MFIKQQALNEKGYFYNSAVIGTHQLSQKIKWQQKEVFFLYP